MFAVDAVLFTKEIPHGRDLSGWELEVLLISPTVHKVQVGESCNETQPSDDFLTSTCRFGLQSQNSRHLSDLRPGFHGLPHPIPRCITWRHQAGDMESFFRRFYAIKACVVFARPSATVEQLGHGGLKVCRNISYNDVLICAYLFQDVPRCSKYVLVPLHRVCWLSDKVEVFSLAESSSLAFECKPYCEAGPLPWQDHLRAKLCHALWRRTVCKVCASTIRAVSFSHVFFSFTRKNAVSRISKRHRFRERESQIWSNSQIAWLRTWKIIEDLFKLQDAFRLAGAIWTRNQPIWGML